MRNGKAFLKGVYDTLRSKPDLWRKTLLIITYDEHGGFYDHVVPPVADLRDARQVSVVNPGSSELSPALASPLAAPVVAMVPPVHADTLIPEAMNIGVSPSALAGVPAFAAAGDPITQDCLTPYGVRVPTFVVSPWVTAGKGPDMVLDHCSILKTVLARFLGADPPFLSDRVAASRSFNAFLNQATPRMDVSAAPAIATVQKGMQIKDRTIATKPVSRAAMRRGNVDYHDLTGRLARMLGR